MLLAFRVTKFNCINPLKRERGKKNNTIKQGGKNKYNSCSWRVLELCLRRKRVEGRIYIPE